MQNVQTLFVSRGVDRMALAAALGITNSAVWQWNVVPPTRVLEVERITGIHRSELRPDLYPVETTEAAQ